MSNICDYIQWRGDLTFEESPLNAIDSVIFCQLSYLEFRNLLPSDFSHGTSIRDAAFLYVQNTRTTPFGALPSPDTEKLLRLAGESKRFGSVLMKGYVSKLDEEIEEQFAALTYDLLNGTYYVAFRGTDDTLLGWKEDFLMSYKEIVPAQKDGVTYLEWVADKVRGKLYVGGHSKGGNLAMHASCFADKSIYKRILKIYNFDGPGFENRVFKKEELKKLPEKLEMYVPHSSIVGLLMNIDTTYSIIESDGSGIGQHDPFNWHLMGIDFILLDKLGEDSQFIKKTVDNWLKRVDLDKREQFVTGLFEIFETAQIKTLSELSTKWLSNSQLIIKAMSSMEPELKEACLQVIKLFFETAKDHIPSIKDLLPTEFGLFKKRNRSLN